MLALWYWDSRDCRICWRVEFEKEPIEVKFEGSYHSERGLPWTVPWQVQPSRARVL